MSIKHLDGLNSYIENRIYEYILLTTLKNYSKLHATSLTFLV